MNPIERLAKWVAGAIMRPFHFRKENVPMTQQEQPQAPAQEAQVEQPEQAQQAPTFAERLTSGVAAVNVAAKAHRDAGVSVSDAVAARLAAEKTLEQAKVAERDAGQGGTASAQDLRAAIGGLVTVLEEWSNSL